ncbi:hypothetical protein Rhal01_01352 [Rubritalea halochordaticola]|uniref:Twin-arginine translocation signal domain-containing protein n=1 Tax=Rubritalea halochordaticola TaxID=714537 RepID=A0ABP9UXT3_9BACT
MNNSNKDNISASRRDFIKTFSVGAVGMSVPSILSAKDAETTPVAKDLHICMGLNTLPFTDKDGTVYKAGECPGPNIDAHSCEGGNSCKGLGACGTGDYARQYWVAENNCATTSPSWNGTGGCGVPVGNGNTGFIQAQLNSAAPTKNADGVMYPADFLGEPIWNIARSRFETKMAANKKSFGVPKNLQSPLVANAWDSTSGKAYPPADNKLPNPYPTPQPPKLPAPPAAG